MKIITGALRDLIDAPLMAEQEAFGDTGYTGVDKPREDKSKTVKWDVALKRSKIKAMPEGALKRLVIAA